MLSSPTSIQICSKLLSVRHTCTRCLLTLHSSRLISSSETGKAPLTVLGRWRYKTAQCWDGNLGKGSRVLCGGCPPGGQPRAAQPNSRRSPRQRRVCREWAPERQAGIRRKRGGEATAHGGSPRRETRTPLVRMGPGVLELQTTGTRGPRGTD